MLNPYTREGDASVGYGDEGEEGRLLMHTHSHNNKTAIDSFRILVSLLLPSREGELLLQQQLLHCIGSSSMKGRQASSSKSLLRHSNGNTNDSSR